MDSPHWTALLSGWRDAPGTLPSRLALKLRTHIQAGRLSSDDPLPAERALSALLGVSRSVVVTTYDDLAAGGWITRRRGSGTRVAATAPRRQGVLTLRTPLNQTPTPDRELDFTHAVPYLTPAHRQELVAAARDAFQESLYHPLGLPDLRALLADTYRAEGLPTRPEQVFITTGAQQAISLTAGTLLQRGDAALMETPTYFGAIDVFRAAGASLVGVPVGPHGVRHEDFLTAARTHHPRLAFLTPTFQNPTGTVMPARTRQLIAAHAHDTALPVIEDDTLIDLDFGDGDGRHVVPPRLATYAPDAPIVNVGSLSKLYWAGLRVGWMRVPDLLHGPLMQAKTLTDFGGSLPAQHIALRLLQDLPRLRRERREHVTHARDLLAHLLRTHLPGWSFDLPDGGQFLWVRLPTEHASHFTHHAARHGLRLFPGASMGVQTLPDHYLRLPFTVDPARLPDAVARLQAAWASFQMREGGERLA
ncbi:aminotransferase-like domain-containing protein [Deinococcus aquiradiocola]|uniref:GntR family transcriptional regulator n=1 Tax=Deinococcus aquiradiocola TaxID=393059 RepID=A0A917P8T9_9DEIO|nr:PLP-dependent aminotransferase family protein [Deinococcus aquiradiocola]GGJ67018.1 GntR family transcriptional regulator [Deinococcus aquiradiocola]